ncbi:hypothetical protein DFH11DRAFT_1544093 [Phellopilus nigrolimitatus]|nr:hypothetical protein DFH11DRAFT_1544093 [Phellopilus nigrolimitatus]
MQIFYALYFLECASVVLAQGLSAGLQISHISVALTSESITMNQASLNFDVGVNDASRSVSNTMSLPVTIARMAADIGILLKDNVILSFDHEFDSFVVPSSSTANSGDVSNVTLTEGLLSTLQIITLPALDIIDANMSISMQQTGVPANFTLNLV